MAEIETLTINGTPYAVRDSRVDNGSVLSQQDILSALGVSNIGKTIYRHNIVLSDVKTKDTYYSVEFDHYYSFITFNIFTDSPTPITTKDSLIRELIAQQTRTNSEWDEFGTNGYMWSKEVVTARGKVAVKQSSTLIYWHNVIGLYVYQSGSVNYLRCESGDFSVIYNPSSTISYPSTYISYSQGCHHCEISGFSSITDIVEEI